MKTRMGWVLAALAVVPMGWAAGVSQSADALKSIDIKGVARPSIRGDKPDEVPSLNAKDIILSELARNMDLSSPGDKVLADPPLLLPPRVASSLVAAPVSGLLGTPPVMDLRVDRPRAGISQWDLTVTDDRGGVFRTIKGKGGLPGHVEWDGLGDSGEPLHVGHPYSCALLGRDAGGVPAFLSTKTVRWPGYVDARSRNVRILLDTEALFSGSGLSRKGEGLLREVRDRLREHRGSVRVDVYGREADAARQQAEAIRDQLAQGLILEKEAVEVSGVAVEDYMRTEIRGR